MGEKYNIWNKNFLKKTERYTKKKYTQKKDIYKNEIYTKIEHLQKQDIHKYIK